MCTGSASQYFLRRQGHHESFFSPSDPVSLKPQQLHSPAEAEADNGVRPLISG